MKTIHRYYLAAALSLMCCAACTHDDDPAATPDAGNLPFAFTALPPPSAAAQHTRAVSGNDQWKGDGTEKIKVMLWRLKGASMGPVGSVGTYTVTTPGGATDARPGDRPLLWPDKLGDYKVLAWYPPHEPDVWIDITDQSTPDKFRQADMLRAEVHYVSYGDKPELPFYRLMAKVRVELTGISPDATDVEVGIRGQYQFYMAENGGWVTRGEEGYITACRDSEAPGGVIAFEAVLFPNSSPKQLKFIRIRTGGKTYYYNRGADDPQSLERGEVYTYRVVIPSSVNP